MTIAFQHHHGAMLLKYSGISFISGAINHGFFSGERSLWTAAIGIVLFVLGAAMEHRMTDSEAEPEQAGLLRTLGLGALLSIGLGFFTGGLQHFPDSPARSAWVVPLGFFISVLALSLSTSLAWQRSTTVYALLVGALVTTGSYGAWQWLQSHPQWAASGHSHGNEHNDAQDSDAHGNGHAHDKPSGHGQHTLPAGPQTLVVNRSMAVRMDDQMRFTPSSMEVRAGETIRFVVHNAGKTAHEMVLGSDADIREHAQAMQQGVAHHDGHSHASGPAITVPAGQKGELVVRFDQPGTLQMACLIPGHYEAGMRGTLKVSEGTPSPAAAQTTNATTASGHEHSAHKH